MLDDHLEFLTCPHCRGAFSRVGNALVCVAGHSFDVARQGYVSLLAAKGREVSGDTAAMVAARADFLAGGHFAPIAAAATRAALRELDRQPGAQHGRRCVVDLGAGTGYYLNHLGEHLTAGYGLVAVDVSKYAMRRAARLYPHLAAVVADGRYAVPVASGSAGLVLAAFAPREAGEIDRILAPEGALVTIVPRQEHLAELVETFGLLHVDPEKRERVERRVGPFLSPAYEVEVSYEMRLSPDEVDALVRMGPSAWHHERDDIEESLRTLPERTRVTAAVSVLAYRR